MPIDTPDTPDTTDGTEESVPESERPTLVEPLTAIKTETEAEKANNVEIPTNKFEHICQFYFSAVSTKIKRHLP
jgi:hypothetical protein